MRHLDHLDVLPTMLIDQYYNQLERKISFTRQQASDFAKKIADDFNPLHDIDSKRFCVPGDLLFSVILAKYGISQHMRFAFCGMVTEDVTLQLPEPSPQLTITSEQNKEYLIIDHSGETSRDGQLIDNLTRSYVTFSGHTFPHILVPLLEEKGVMINPDRPMVMYQSMLIDLHRLDCQSIDLELDKQQTLLEVNGKRGNVCLAFNLLNEGKLIGRGEKHMVVSGLKPFEEEVVASISSNYAQWKKDFNA